MKSFLTAIMYAPVAVLPIQAQGNPRAQAEDLVAKAADFLQASGLDRLVHEINHAGGRFAATDASKPQLMVYDLKGKTLAFGGDARHIGMNHSKVIATLLDQAKSSKKGWYEPPTEAGGMKVAIYFEKAGEVLITTSIHLH